MPSLPTNDPDRQTHFVADGLIGKEVAGKGKGAYTTRAFKKGDLLAVWGGDILNRRQLEKCSPEQQMHAVQVEEGCYIVPHGEPEVGDLFNHSCDPNAGVQGQIALCAMRDIEAGEEICFDYSTTDSSDYDEFTCGCGVAACRGVVRGDDWKRPDVQAKYAGWFSPYLARRIAKLNGGG